MTLALTRIRSLIAALLVSTLALSTVGAGESRLTASATVDTASKYIWRGFNVVDDAVLQPGVSLSAYNVTLGYWGNMDLTDINGEEHEFTEHDVYASYGLDLGQAGTLEVGAILYYFPSLEDADGNDDRDALDVYGSYSFSLGELVAESAAGYYEVDEWDAWYANFGLSREFELPSEWTLGTAVAAGYAGENYNRDAWGVADADADWNDLTASLSLSGALSESVSASFSFNYAELLSGKIADSVEAAGGTPDNFWTMAGIEVAF